MKTPAESLYDKLTDAKQNALLASRPWGKREIITVFEDFIGDVKREGESHFNCFRCRDGHTPLYCLNCAGDLLPKTPAPKKPKQADMTDEEWIESLTKEPAYQGINVRKEISLCAMWYKTNVSKTGSPSRRRIVNWLGKAERVVDLKAMGAQHATGLKPPPPKGPEGWLQWLETELLSISPDHPAHGQLTAARNCQAFHLLPASWQARCISALHFTPLVKQVETDMALRNT